MSFASNGKVRQGIGQNLYYRFLDLPISVIINRTAIFKHNLADLQSVMGRKVGCDYFPVVRVDFIGLILRVTVDEDELVQSALRLCRANGNLVWNQYGQETVHSNTK